MKSKAAAHLSLMAFTVLIAASVQCQTGPVPAQVGQGGGIAVDAPVLVNSGPGFQFVSSAPLSGRVIKGAPYSIEATIDTTQTLGDGNRIVHHSTVRMYRDAEGRTRREETLTNIGPWAAAGRPPTLVTIQDPVLGVSYLLDSEHKMAARLHSPPVLVPRLNSDNQSQYIAVQSLQTSSVNKAGGGGSKGPDVFAYAAIPTIPDAAQDTGYVATQGYVSGDGTATKAESSISTPALMDSQKTSKDKSQSLGKESIAGVLAEGTRISSEIPAGAVGNERPIELANEKWYSPELQIVLRMKQSDPRLGDTDYEVTRLDRAEPPHSLFEVPPDYQLRDGEPFHAQPK